MSNFTSTSFSYTSTTNTDGGTTTGRRFSTASTTDKEGLTIIRTARQDLGQPAIIEERRYDKSGQEQQLPAPPEMAALPSPGAGMGEPGEGEVQRITEVNDETASYGGGDMGTEVYGLNSKENVNGSWGNLGTATEPVETGTTRVQYEDPNTGAKLRKESEIDMSQVLG
jgi:hypothetical protein